MSSSPWPGYWSDWLITDAQVSPLLLPSRYCISAQVQWSEQLRELLSTNDLTIGWQNWNPLSLPNATLSPQARQARASGKKLYYATLASQARPSGRNFELLAESLVWYPTELSLLSTDDHYYWLLLITIMTTISAYQTQHHIVNCSDHHSPVKCSLSG